MTEPADPKNAMKRALEFKKQQQSARDSLEQSADKAAGKPQHRAAAKRVFRRKAGS
ncbi:MAG: hypothetical protein LBI84_00255 [Propionibacteriaceae bacterium]|jgi:hypothetical protein|nr:hypothetical protein [Propionibacteriaceae bacterium]